MLSYLNEDVNPRTVRERGHTIVHIPTGDWIFRATPVPFSMREPLLLETMRVFLAEEGGEGIARRWRVAPRNEGDIYFPRTMLDCKI